MVVDDVVEGAVDTIINIQGLGLSLAALSCVDFCSDCRACTYKVTAWLGNESQFAGGFNVHFLFEFSNRRSHGCSNLLEGRHARATVSSFVAWETATDVNETHWGHANFVGI